MVQPTRHRNGDHLVRLVGWRSRKCWRVRKPLPDPLMWPSLIEGDHIGLEKPVELLLVEDQKVLKTFSPHAQEKAFADGIRSRSSVRCPKHLDATCCGYSRKTRPKFPVSSPNQIAWLLSIRSRFSQLLCDPGIGGRARSIHVHDLARFQFDNKEDKKRTEEEIRDLEEIAGPHVFCMIVQERSPVLSSRPCSVNAPHILLNSSFTHSNIQLEEFTTDALSSEDADCVPPSP
jgi:hypothetical protein